MDREAEPITEQYKIKFLPEKWTFTILVKLFVLLWGPEQPKICLKLNLTQEIVIKQAVTASTDSLLTRTTCRPSISRYIGRLSVDISAESVDRYSDDRCPQYTWPSLLGRVFGWTLNLARLGKHDHSHLFLWARLRVLYNLFYPPGKLCILFYSSFWWFCLLLGKPRFLKMSERKERRTKYMLVLNLCIFKKEKVCKRRNNSPCPSCFQIILALLFH